jgi:hypothetical protein
MVNQTKITRLVDVVGVVRGLVWLMTKDGIAGKGLSKLGDLWLHLVILSFVLSEPAIESIRLSRPRT